MDKQEAMKLMLEKFPDMKKYIDLMEAQAKLQNIFDSFMEDVNLCTAHLKDHPFWRRNYCRTIFTLLEAMTYQKKQVALEASKCFGVELLPTETNFIHEKQFYLADDGSEKERTQNIQIKSNLKLSFHIYAKAHNGQFKLQTGDKGWESLDKAIKIRNRLTHPKGLMDIEASPQDCTIFTDTLVWYSKNYGRLVPITQAAVANVRAKIASGDTVL